MKFTFKKHARETGLRAVGNSTPSVDIKLDGKRVGLLQAPNWQTPDRCWGISVSVKGSPKDNSSCSWHWVSFKARPETEELARQFVTERLEVALIKHNMQLHAFD